MPKKVSIGLGSLILTALLLELGFRALESPLGIDRKQLAHMRAYVCDGDLGWYAPHPYWVFTKKINSFGFNDLEWKMERTPGVPRIVCIGGSTTEGGNPQGHRGAFPYMVKQELEKRCGRAFEVLNAGMSYWNSAELLTSWFLLLQDFRPDLLVIEAGINDCEPRVWPGFWPDYRHFRRPLRTPVFSLERVLLTRWSDLFTWLQSSANVADLAEVTRLPLAGSTDFARTGSLDPSTARSFRRNIEAIGENAAAHGTRVMLVTCPLQPPTEQTLRSSRHYFLGVTQHNEILRELAREHGWMLADAARIDELDEARRKGLFITLAHVTPEGNQLKADYIMEALTEAWPPELGQCAGR
jgi:hypothetical protein